LKVWAHIAAHILIHTLCVSVLTPNDLTSFANPDTNPTIGNSRMIPTYIILLLQLLSIAEKNSDCCNYKGMSSAMHPITSVEKRLQANWH
jgi:hypothetical protein